MTGSFRWFLLLWICCIYLFCATRVKSLKPPSLPNISPGNDEHDQTILFDYGGSLELADSEKVVNDRIYASDVDMTMHLLGKRLCLNYDGYGNNGATPLSFNCEFRREKGVPKKLITKADMLPSFKYRYFVNG